MTENIFNTYHKDYDFEILCNCISCNAKYSITNNDRYNSHLCTHCNKCITYFSQQLYFSNIKTTLNTEVEICKIPSKFLSLSIRCWVAHSCEYYHDFKIYKLNTCSVLLDDSKPIETKRKVLIDEMKQKEKFSLMRL